ncbi:MAG: hypothetical protein ACYC64_12990 [Armatimonadota bacterium]
MPRAKNVEYIVDEKGRKKAVVMSYRAYTQLMEDLSDLSAIVERRHEQPEGFEVVLAELKSAGRIKD